MNNKATNENPDVDLTQRKSLLIIQAQFQQAMGQQGEAARLFLAAALLEERLADGFRQAGKAEDAAISLFSAASCYKHAGRIAEAASCAASALSLTGAESFAEEIRQFLAGCRNTASLPSQRSLQGIVRNGAIYPCEPAVLPEGELVTITMT